MKKIFVIISFLMFTSVYFSNAQVQVSAQDMSISADVPTIKRNSFIILTTKANLKDLKVNSIDIIGLDDPSLKSNIASSYDLIMKIKSQAPSNNILIQLLNNIGAAGFIIVGTSSTATETELINTYTMSISN
jgi:precorrin-6B methylase 2